MYIRTKYHPATNYRGQRLSVSLYESFSSNDGILIRSYVSFGTIQYYNFSSTKEEVLFALEQFFDIQRKAKHPLFIGNSPIDTSWNWTGIQLHGHNWMFVDQSHITVAHTIKYMRECVVKSVQSLTPPK